MSRSRPPTPHVTLLVGWEFVEADEVAHLFYSTFGEIQYGLATRTFVERPTGEVELTGLEYPGLPRFLWRRSSDPAAPAE